MRSVDILPTILNILKIPYKNRQFDGVSLLEVIKKNKYLNLLGYSETFYPEEQTSATGGLFYNAKNKISFRINNKYKIIQHQGNNQVEFYDLENDQNELNNLAQ